LEADKSILAKYIQDAFARELTTKYMPGPNTAGIHLAPTRAVANTPTIATIARLAPAGLALDSIRVACGKEEPSLDRIHM
jgi:hypothetical protein